MTSPPGRMRPRAGLRILIPGYAQWTWSQRERALVLFGSFTMALGMAVFAWGTRTGLAMLAFAFLAHVVSTVDVVQQGAFPDFGRWMQVVSVSGSLAVGFYAPALMLATLLAWPGMPRDETSDGYLVNCWAYRGREPSRGDWVWHRTSPWGEPRVGRVVASPGTEVEWSGGGLRLAGETLRTGAPLHSSPPPLDLAYTVPEGHVLIDAAAVPRGEESSARLVLVPREQILGRAWARFYPLRDRGPLP